MTPIGSGPPLAQLADLRGKVALVTGAAQGFGAACADRLSEAGASVVLADVQGEACLATCEQLTRLGREVEAIEVDVSSEADVERAVAATVERFGRLDTLVNNAGTWSNVLIEELSEAEFRRVLDLNLVGAFLCTRAAARQLRRQGSGGSIVNISSIDAIRPSAPGLTHYDASKHAIWGLTKASAAELGPAGVRVNAIAPGSSYTEGVQAWLAAGEPHGHDVDTQFTSIADGTPLGRACEPDEVARVAVFLASELASFVTGAQVVVDGGFLLT